jgi:hypothetical protein
LNASGLAAVRARENTRKAIWDAFKRREVFAPSGTRIRVRVFGGFDFEEGDRYTSNFAGHGHDNGVPMGGDLNSALSGAAPVRFSDQDDRYRPDLPGLDQGQHLEAFIERTEAARESHERAEFSICAHPCSSRPDVGASQILS